MKIKEIKIISKKIIKLTKIKDNRKHKKSKIKLKPIIKIHKQLKIKIHKNQENNQHKHTIKQKNRDN